MTDTTHTLKLLKAKIEGRIKALEELGYETEIIRGNIQGYEKALEDIKELMTALKSIDETNIDWDELRKNFFTECTTETSREESGKKVNIAPHDLFEWFKREISEYVG